MKWPYMVAGLILVVQCTAATETALSLSSPVAKEYYAAAVSVTNLQAFIQRHPDEPGWCGEAQIRIAHIHSQQGANDVALSTLQTAIEKYGKSVAPDRNIRITVADVARIEMALLLKRIGRADEARQTLASVQNKEMRESLLNRFREEDKEGSNSTSEGIRHPADGLPKPSM